MGRLVSAFRTFFRILFDREFAEGIERTFLEGPVPETAESPAQATKVSERPGRSDALTLLATLQQESRLVDFLKEPLDSYSDEQIGAAVREVHRGCRDVLERLFAVRPVLEEEEGADVDVPSGFDAFRFRLTGNVGEKPPFRGRVTHQGWEARKCDLPLWTGDAAAARVLAPAEVEVA